MSTDLPHWLGQLLDGLAEFDSMHPKLFYETGAAPGQWFKADCPCHLLCDVPDDVLARARAYMDGWRTAQEAHGAERAASGVVASAETTPAVTEET